MNIFYLHKEPEVSARLHCDKHVVKMIIEYAQILSTAHRMIDGEQYYDLSKNGRRIARWRHPNSNLENVLYKASHQNHPSAVWVRENAIQYQYMYDLFVALCDEYTVRYGKEHKSRAVINWCDENRPELPEIGLTSFAQAMPDEYKNDDVVEAYRAYYLGDKKEIAEWKNNNVPHWYYQGEANV